MQTPFIFARYSALSLALLLSFPGAAQFQKTTNPAGPGLRVIVTPLSNSPVLRVRYESPAYGAVRLSIRNAQGQVLYTDLVRQSRFAGDFSLAAWPAGDYTIELQTPAERRTEIVRLAPASPVLATLVTP